MTNKYHSFKPEFAARHTDESPTSIRYRLAVFSVLMFAVGFGLGYYLSATEAAYVVAELDR